MKEIEVVTEKMVFEGKALARQDRYVVFVEGALPGEKVRAVITAKKKQFAHARVLEILEPSPLRREPDCPLFGHCGGCNFRHCAYETQLEFKQAIFLESLHGVPGVPDIIRPILPMDPPLFYRNKMVFTFGLEDGNPVLGLHRRNDFYRIVPLENCLLQSPESNEILRRTLSLVKASQIPVFDELAKTGLLRTLMIREGKHTGQRMIQVNVTGLHPALQELPGLYGDLCSTVIVGVDRRISGPPQPVERHVLKGPGLIEETLNGMTFTIHPDTFFQTNTIQAERLFLELIKMAGGRPPRLALDLYAGTGPIAMHLSPVAESVLGMESNAESVRAAEENCRRNNLGNVRMICAEVEKAGPGQLPREAGLVVVDPPRPGLHAKALSKIAGLSPDRILYVSCNPATLARDLKQFSELGYSIMQIQPVDMFPHTFHIEALALLERRQGVKPPCGADMDERGRVA